MLKNDITELLDMPMRLDVVIERIDAAGVLWYAHLDSPMIVNHDGLAKVSIARIQDCEWQRVEPIEQEDWE
jgi:hypothetical protein